MTEIAFLVKPDTEMYRKYFKQKNELDKFVGFASSFIDKYFVSRNKDFDYSFSTNMCLTTFPLRQILALLVTSLEAVKNQDKVIGVQQESVDFHRAVSASVNSVDFGEFAKCLANDHINIGRNRLMAWLRKEKYIDASNIAYQKYIQQGIFEVKETVYYIGKASHTARKTLITPKGQVYLAKKVSSGYKG